MAFLTPEGIDKRLQTPPEQQDPEDVTRPGGEHGETYPPVRGDWNERLVHDA